MFSHFWMVRLHCEDPLLHRPWYSDLPGATERQGPFICPMFGCPRKMLFVFCGIGVNGLSPTRFYHGWHGMITFRTLLLT